MTNIAITREEAEALGQVLDYLEKIREVLEPHEAWINFPITLGSELVDGLEGTVDHYYDGTAGYAFKPKGNS